MSPLFSRARQTLQQLLLQSHGLRDPLTAIRWGSNRLRKGEQGLLTDEQRAYMVDQVYLNSKILTAMVESMVLIAELEQKIYEKQKQDVCLRMLFTSFIAEFSHVKESTWKVQGPHLHVQTDRRILEMLIRNLLMLRTGFGKEPVKLLLEVEERDRQLGINFYSSLVFPVLGVGEENELIGGTPGLLLSLAGGLAEALGGTVEIQKKVGGNFVALQTGEDLNPKDLTSKQYKIALRLPLDTMRMGEDCVPLHTEAVAEGVMLPRRQKRRAVAV